jgi:O-antigen/teichoic acid export membrane protein
MLMVIAKLTSPELVGEFVLGLAITAPIIMFANLQLRLLQATDAGGKFEFQDYLGLRVITLGLAIIVIFAVVLIGDYRQTTAYVIVWVGFSKIIDALSDIAYGLFQRYERMDRMALSQIIRGVSALAGLSIGIYVTRDLLVGVYGLITGWLVGLVIFDIPNVKKILKAQMDVMEPEKALFRPHWKLSNLKGIFLLGLPLGVVTLLRSLNANIPRYFIEHHQGLYELGIFGGLVYILTAERRLTQALGQTVSPRLSQYFQSDDLPNFRRLLLGLMAITSCIGLVVLLGTLILGEQILTLLYSSEYARYENLFILLALAAIFDQSIVILGYGLTAARNLIVQVPLDVFNLITLLIGCSLLIPKYGLTGATFALLISKAFGFVTSSIVILRSI